MGIKVRFLNLTVHEEDCQDPGCKNNQHKIQIDTYTTLEGTIVGELQIGDMYFTPDHRDKYKCTWSNCDGQHLFCILPDSHHWNIDGRASNCTLPADATHRCWVRHGNPRIQGQIHVDKSGNTCSAGGGSIKSGKYHGHLHHGELT